MKRLMRLFIAIVFLLMLSSCVSDEENIKQESIDAVNGSLFSEIPLDVGCVATISPEKFVIESLTGVSAFVGKPVQYENSSAFHLSAYFEEMCEMGMVCHQDPTELQIHFSDEIPSELMWRQCFYRASTDSISDKISEEFTTVENVSNDIVLQLGNSASVLYAAAQTEPAYRIVHIICQYENQKVEYYAIFDGWMLNDK